MKSLIMILSLVGFQALAKSKMEYKWPSINGLQINNACATDTTFRSVKPVKVCLETAVATRTACRYHGEVEVCRILGLNETPRIDEMVTERTKCIKQKSKTLTVSRETTAMKCVKWSKPKANEDVECLDYETVTTLMGKVFNVEAFKIDSAEKGPEFAGFIKYEIPDCK